MRVGIITFTYGDNFGQRLQNLAVQEVLKQYFDEVYTIRQIKRKMLSKAKIKENVKQIMNRKYLSRIKRHKAFCEFDDKYINFFPIAISEKNMREFPEEAFDMFIAGSDQIWSPFSPDVNDTMFLSFTSEEKRVSFSPSIAAETIPRALEEKYTNYFNGFRAISVREEQGAELVKHISGKRAEVLIDPTLMFEKEFWNNYIVKPEVNIPIKYALLYFLGTNDDKAKVSKFCNDRKLKMIDVLSDKEYCTLGPSEFLYLIKNAEVIITDSYHGTIFSILYKKPFIICNRTGTSLNMNSRFTTLFSKLSISPRYIGMINTNEKIEYDFNMCQYAIDKERRKVWDYLSRVCYESVKERN